MTDFYALLKQSILDRRISSADDRAEIYAQARQAVVKQLWDFRPPLAADEIDMRVGAYDAAVQRIEVDLKAVFAGMTERPSPAPTRAQTAPQERPSASVRPMVLKPQPAPTRASRYVGGGRGQAAALAERAQEQMHYEAEVEQAAPATYTEPLPEDDYYDDTLIYYDEEEIAEVARERPRFDRWSSGAAQAEPPPPFIPLPDWLTDWLGNGEERKVRVLAVAIGALFIVLVAVAAFLLGAHSQGRSSGNIERTVSDAATAARIPSENVTVAHSYVVFDGRDPTVFQTTPNNPIRFDNANGFAQIASSTSASGVKVLIGVGLAARLAGHDVRVVIEARSSVERGAETMRFAYQSGLAISHWQTANLTQDYQPLGLMWRVPTMRTSPSGDLLIIEPGIPGDDSAIDVRSIRIDVLASS